MSQQLIEELTIKLDDTIDDTEVFIINNYISELKINSIDSIEHGRVVLEAIKFLNNPEDEIEIQKALNSLID